MDFSHFSDALWWLPLQPTRVGAQVPSGPLVEQKYKISTAPTEADLDSKDQCYIPEWNLISTSRLARGWEGGAGNKFLGPMGRWGHTLVAYDRFLIVFGGSCPGQAFDVLWVIDMNPVLESQSSSQGLENLHWIKLDVFGTPPRERLGHAAVVVDGYMYVYGGNNVEESFHDIMRINLTNLKYLRHTAVDRTRLNFEWEHIVTTSHPLSLIHISEPTRPY